MSSGGGGTPANTTSQVVLPDWINQTAQKNLATADNVAARPYQADPYATVAPLSSDQLAAYQTVRNLQGSTTGDFDASKAAASGLLSSAAPITTDQLTSDTQSLFNPYQTAVVDPSVALMRQQLGQSLSGVRANASNVGAFGGSRQGLLEGQAISQEALQAGQLEGGLLSSGWSDAANRASDLAKTNLAAGEWATTTLPALSVGETTEAGKLAAAQEQVGKSLQAQDQGLLGTQSAQWEDQYNYPIQQLGIQEDALKSLPYGSTNISTGTTPVRNQALGVLGGAASGAAIGSSFGPYGTAIGAVGGGLLGAFA